MPLPPSEPREELHLRRVEVRGYRRHDGLYEVEGRIVDTKSHELRLESTGRPLPAGAHLHEMSVRLVFDSALKVHDVIAVTDASPHAICPEAAASMAQIKGLTIGAGWNRALREKLSGARGCQHMTELLAPMATTAIQTLSPLRNALPAPLDENGRPKKIDTCHAYASHREVVLKRWPDHYDGPKAG